ncbi:MAG: peptidase M13 [Propionibacteriaceae bacterium]|jgi:putative endopeptidase|nr:peptidase M13 [Propionibacteriaceae bacterium]
MAEPALHLEDFDAATPPTQDLFQHVNGAWLARATIPDDKGAWGAFELLREASEKAVHEIITTAQPGDDESSETAKIANLYTTFMDEARANELGVTPLAPILERIDAIQTTSDLARYFGWCLRHGIGTLFDLENDSDPGDPNAYIMFIGQDGLGLPDEEYYRLDEHAETRAKYVAHVERMLRLVGVVDAAAAAAAILALETTIASKHWDKVRTRDMVEMYHKQTWDEFVSETPSFDWAALLEGAELPSAAVKALVNAQRSFPADVAPLICETPIETWRLWAKWNAVGALAPFLDAATAEANFDFYGRTLQGIPVMRERWKRGVSFTQGVMGEAIGKVYVERHFPPSVKAKTDALVANLLEAYRVSIADIDWMSDATRGEALAKLAAFRPKIGYPNKWRDYSRLVVVPGDLVGNALRADSFEFDHVIEQLSGPVDPEEWFMYPQTVNAYYHPLRNEIVFPAAILQPPFFNADADDAVNYGGIGAVIGHEIGHGFDDQGSTCDGEGRLRDWWTEADHEAFEERTHALVAQFDGLHPSVAPEASVNGELTLGENIGDLGGLGIAYKAWLISCGGTAPSELIDGFTPTQRLFLSWGAVWQDLSRAEQMKERVATDPHSPSEFRCNVTARNIDAFHEAFGTQPGDGMWLDTQDRVVIW